VPPCKLGDELANRVAAARRTLVVLRIAAQPAQHQLSAWEFRVELPQLIEVGVGMQRELGGTIECGQVLQRQLFGRLVVQIAPTNRGS